ncbi:pilus assembly protein TadG-related protein [Caldalkalibacillus mannanilyticus]|uniref:pilus assembly protein TadG-related protein n=1 Tax=Caldalkalibacillus mannanilyticus TaxID=1418 RepID=UPI00046AA987|nr:pilus assembly protein TadG-related protein [Caldalkalibacillus mannanilyticus]
MWKPDCRTKKHLVYEQRGSATLLTILSMLGLLAIAGLAIDGGSLYMMKSHLQKTANAAALSGAQELTNSETAVRNVVQRIVNDHREQESLREVNITMRNRVNVRLEKEIPLTFMSIFGWSSTPVRVSATAEIGTMGRAHGAAPLGIDESIQLEFYKNYELKVDETGVDTGNFGVLALGGGGAKTYEDNLIHGYQNEVKVNDIIPTQTGNIAGKTRVGVNARITACPYLKGETHYRDCPRVILIPVYQPHNHNQNQMKEIKVKGFAYFYILDPMNGNDKTIKGMFIQRAGVGFVDPSLVDKGAYSIRLTE